jgi:predicted MFS family arabinose efflux permease
MGVYAVLLTFGFIGSILGLRSVVEDSGWRTAWAGMGWLLIGGLAPVGWLLVRKTPEACGMTADQETIPEQRPSITPEDFSLRQALRTPAFWIFSLATSLFNLLWSAITLFNESILKEHGFGPKTFDLVMALLAGSGLVSNLLAGWLATRWSMGRLLAVGMLLLAGSLMAFPLIQTQTHVVLYALVLGMSGGIITVVFFACYGRMFGRAHLGHIQGAAQVLSVLASALGPVMLAVCRDATSSYDPFFYGMALVAGLMGLGCFSIRGSRPTSPRSPT